MPKIYSIADFTPHVRIYFRVTIQYKYHGWNQPFHESRIRSISTQIRISARSTLKNIIPFEREDGYIGKIFQGNRFFQTKYYGIFLTGYRPVVL